MSIVYDRRVGQYRGDNGRFVPRDRVLEVIETEVGQLQAKLQNHVRRALSGAIDAGTLAQSMSQDLKIASIQMAAIGKGGIDRLTFSDYGKIGKMQQERNKRLRGFIDALLRGQLSEKQVLQRAAQYAGSIKQAHSVIEHSEQVEYYQQAKRILKPGAQHCDECVRYQTNGWIDAVDVVPIATRCSCRQNCKCQIFYRNFIAQKLLA